MSNTTCKICGNTFEATRSTAKFCSAKCKLAYHRNKVSVSNEPTKNAKSDTLSDTVIICPKSYKYIVSRRLRDKRVEELNKELKELSSK